MGETKNQIINLINEQKYVEDNTDEATIKEVIQSISENEVLAIFGGCSDATKEKIINSVHNVELKENLIEHLDLIMQYKFIQDNKSEMREDFINKAIKKFLNSGLDDLKKKILFEDKNLPNVTNLELRQIFEKKFVKENIKDIIKLEFDENVINKKLELITQIEENVGDNIYLNLDFKILDDKYIDTIGIDGIINIALNNGKQKELLGLDETKLKIISECLKNNPVRNELDTYKILIETMLSNLSNDSFSDLINSIDDINNLTETDIKTFQKVLQKENIFELRSLEDLRNYEALKRQKCDEWINSEDFNIKRKAVLEKIFGQDWYYPLYYDIEELQNGNIKTYLQCIKKIGEINNPQILEKIYYKCSEQIEVDEITIKKDIKSEYGKLYNEGLFNIDNAHRVEVNDSNNVFEAGTDFRMIIHSRIRIRDRGGFDNYYDDWNRRKNFQGFADYFCASYIRNDMITGAGIEKNVTYGFSSLVPNSFCGSSHGDMGTTICSMAQCSSPEYLINNVGKDGRGIIMKNPYNEIDYKYFSNGERQQPSYIVVFKINGEIENWNDAIKAQNDWKGKLPIVIVDVNKCIEAEKQKVEQMKKEYEKSKSPMLARQIYHKIRNNQHTIKSYKGRLQESFFEGELEQYLVSDEEIEKYMEDNNEKQMNISPTMDRPKTKIEKIYDQINAIISEKDTIEQDFKTDTQEEMEQVIQDEPQTIETQIEITPKDIAKLDQDRKITTTEVKRNPLIKLLDKAKEITEKIIQGKKKDGK